MKKAVRSEKAFKLFLWAIFVLYIVLLFYLLFIGETIRPYRYFDGGLFSKEHLYYSNFTPFKTIRELESLVNSGRLLGFSVFNLLGNLLAFAPFGFFLPLLFPKKFSSFFRFFLFEFLLISAVEILQFITYRGSLDIDDLILNLSGACLFFGITRAIMTFSSKKENKK